MRKIVPLILVVLAAIVALLWLVLSPGDTERATTPGPGADDVTGDVTATHPADEPGPGRRRIRHQGTSVVHGEVRLSRGEAPVAGQTVTLVRSDAEHGGADPWTAQTDATGAFRITALPHGGPYELRVVAGGHATVRLPGIALDRGEVRDVGTLWLDRAVRAEVLVRTLADAPLPGAEVRAFAAPEMREFDWSRNLAQLGVEVVPVATATTDAEGRAEFPELAAGSWTFTAAKPGYAMRGRPARQLRADDGAAPVTIHLGRGYSLQGRVTDQDGAGIAHALLLAAPPSIAWSPQVAPLRQRAVADEDGRYELVALAAGDAVIYAGRPGAPPGAVGTVRIPAVATFDVVLRAGGVLEGVVTTSTGEGGPGEPAAGAVVRASSFGSSGNTVAEAVTDDAGRYTISSLAEGTVNRLTVEKEGYVQADPDGGVFRPFPLPHGQRVVRDLVLGIGVPLTGIVRGPDGPLPGARVTAYSGINRIERTSTTSDAEGRYAYAALRPGPAIVQVEALGYHQLDFPGNWWQVLRQGENRNKIELEEGGAASLDVEMGAGSAVEGRVETLDGEPVAGARVAVAGAGRNRGAGRAPAAISEADGTFRIQGLVPGVPVRISAQRRGYGTLAADAVDVLADRPTTGVVIQLAPLPRVTGRITTLDGEPAAEAYVELQHRAEAGVAPDLDADLFWGNAVRHPVRPDGTYEIVLPSVAGSFSVTATAPGLPTTRSAQTTLSPDRAVYEVDLTFPAGDTLRGIVLAQETGDPLVGAWVRVNQVESRERDGLRSQVAAGPTIVAVTDGAGRFEIEALPRGKHRIQASAVGRVDTGEDVELPRTADVRLLLPTERSIAGVVVQDGGAPVEGATVFARQDVAAGGARRSWSAITDVSGSFDVRGLPPGTYVLTVSPGWRGGPNIVQQTSEPLEAGAREVRLVVRSGLKIAGRVVDAGGSPVAAAQVSASPKERRPGVRGRSMQTDRDGSFEIGGLLPGAYTLSVMTGRSGRFRPARRDDVAAGATGIEIVLTEGLTIEGVLLDTAGRPLANARISAQSIGERRSVGSAAPDERGRFTISGLEPGRYRLDARTFGADGMTRLIVQGGEDVVAGATGIRVTASQGASLAGIVVDETGTPIAGARVAVTLEGNVGTQTVRSAADGRFEVRGLPPGAPVTVQATANGFRKSDGREHTPGEANVRIELASGLSADGVVLGAGGQPLARTRLDLRQRDGAAQSTRTDDRGRFTVRGLLPGTYDASVMIPDPNGGKQLVRRSCGTLRAGETGATLQVR